MRVTRAVVLCGTLSLAIAAGSTGCSLAGEDRTDPAEGEPDTEVVLVTHESFALPKGLLRDFEADSGYQLRVLKRR